MLPAVIDDQPCSAVGKGELDDVTYAELEEKRDATVNAPSVKVPGSIASDRPKRQRRRVLVRQRVYVFCGVSIHVRPIEMCQIRRSRFIDDEASDDDPEDENYDEDEDSEADDFIDNRPDDEISAEEYDEDEDEDGCAIAGDVTTEGATTEDAWVETQTASLPDGTQPPIEELLVNGKPCVAAGVSINLTVCDTQDPMQRRNMPCVDTR